MTSRKPARTERGLPRPVLWRASIARTLQRWKTGDGLARGDRRPDAIGRCPAHALSEAERARIIEVANEPRFAETPPARIVPALADEGDLHRQRVQLPSRAARAWPDEPPRPSPAATGVAPADHAHRHPPRRGLVLGCDVPAGTDPGTLVLSLPDPRPLQPQDRRLRGA